MADNDMKICLCSTDLCNCWPESMCYNGGQINITTTTTVTTKTTPLCSSHLGNNQAKIGSIPILIRLQCVIILLLSII